MSVIIVDKSTRALTSAAATLNKTLVELQNGVEALVQEQSSLADEIYFKKEELKEIESQNDVAVRSAAAELRLRIKEDEEQVLTELLDSRNLVTTTEADIADLNAQVIQAHAELEAAEFKAVHEAEQLVRAQYQARISTQEANHKVEIAELNANAKADKQAIATLTEQVTQLREDLKAEREARVAMAEAAAKAQGVVVNTGK